MHLTGFLAFCALLAASLAASLGQQPFSSNSLDEEAPILNAGLDAAIQEILAEFKSPGGAGVAVARKTAAGTWRLESKGYGNATGAGDKVDEHTLFSIGSNSKLFDVLATGLLISNETLSPRILWNSKVASIVPGWKLADPVATSESTIVDIMSHRTGLPRHDLMEGWEDGVEDIIARLQYLRPSAGFRELAQYNNHMYTVLSSFPKTLVDTPFEQYVHDNIFVPFGLNATTYFYADAVATGRLADGFTRQDANLTHDPFDQGTVRVLPYWDQSSTHAISGAGGVISSAHDMAIWLQALLQEGTNQANETVIPASVIQKVATGVTVYFPIARYPELSPGVYGGGQLRGTYRGFGLRGHTVRSMPHLFQHGGAAPGFKSQVARFPSENFGVAVLTNDEELGASIRESIKYRIVDEVLSLHPYIDWTARYREQVAAAVPPPSIPRSKDAAPPSVPYTALAGKYHNAGYRSLDFCLFWHNATHVPMLIARHDTGAGNHLRLSHYEGDKFNVTVLNVLDGDAPWVRKTDQFEAEFEVDGEDVGFALIGVWGPGQGAEPLQGETVRERAEVWFSKME
ncbi:beta-lactamase/transpeptidase-like protein [Roridomyces roridus]|uniref:Beta-lactamase/transpeptidase-like protein n=1 Tax=Roridomyces roridus TaxID=1738132 RepID=A0AAD7BLX6_9AGAR|nr:beta-lactamase/transpeptidase-like protein [Roridomyces roridus]